MFYLFTKLKAEKAPFVRLSHTWHAVKEVYEVGLFHYKTRTAVLM